MAGVVVAFATLPPKPFAETTDTLVTVPLPAGEAQVPSARKKFVVPPPLAGARPLSAEVNASSIDVASACVISVTGPMPLDGRPLNVNAPVFASFAFVTAELSIVQVIPLELTVISPLSPSVTPTRVLDKLPETNARPVPIVALKKPPTLLPYRIDVPLVAGA